MSVPKPTPATKKLALERRRRLRRRDLSAARSMVRSCGQPAGSASCYNRRMVYLSKIYTKTGDRGQTALVGGQMVPKDSARIEAYGTVDELNAVIGLVLKANAEEKGPDEARARLQAILGRVQNELFNLGSILAT